MKKKWSFLFLSVICVLNTFAWEREYVWPSKKMPHFQKHQIALMANELSREGNNNIAYLEWFDKPIISNNGCMILISGGSYNHCCDFHLINMWREQLTKLGFQCVNLVYRTPRPVGIPFYQTAWEDGQRAVRIVRSEAKKRGFDSEKIGVISMSAGSHLALLLATSSQTPAYEKIDRLDSISSHLNWAIVNAPAYITTDAQDGTPASRDGYGPDVKLVDILKFDAKTCPMTLQHGGKDIYSPNGSTLIYRKLRKMGIPAELHLYPNLGHGAYGFDRAVEFMKQMGFLGAIDDPVNLMHRYNNDNERASYLKESIWPTGKMPNTMKSQDIPYIEWHFPRNLKTKAIQIIFSGGSYNNSNPDDYEVAPARRYLNEKGMTVVTLKYRTPRPSKESGLAKHTTAWQDLQRTIRIVRHEATARGLDPNKIGVMGSSAGGHLACLGITNSCQRSYLPIDDIDQIPCNVQWGICMYPAYLLTDGYDMCNTTGGNEDSTALVNELNFDKNTVPALFIHGDADSWSAMNSVKAWEHMRSMGIQCELHTLAKRKHCFQSMASPETGSYNFLERIGKFIDKMIDE